MATITNEIRTQISHAILQHGFKAEFDTVAAQQEALFHRVRERIYDKEVKAAIDLLVAYGADNNIFAVKRASTLLVNVGGEKRSVGRKHGFTKGYMSFSRDFGAFLLDGHDNSWSVALTVTADDDLANDIICGDEAWDDLAARYKERQAEVDALLATIRTDGQLANLWPEAMTLAAPFLKVKVVNTLPATLRADLNASLGLPADTVEEVKEEEFA